VIVKEDITPIVTYGDRSEDCENNHKTQSLEESGSDVLEIFDKDLNYNCTRLWNDHKEDTKYAVVSVSIAESKVEDIDIDSELVYMEAKSNEEIYFSIPDRGSNTNTFKLKLAIENPFSKLEKPIGKVNQINTAILVSNVGKNWHDIE
jgi:hypothetical protein